MLLPKPGGGDGSEERKEDWMGVGGVEKESPQEQWQERERVRLSTRSLVREDDLSINSPLRKILKDGRLGGSVG